MSQNLRYREQIDACRPGSDDLALPALAELAGAVETDRSIAEEFARSERFDRAVGAALHDVPVPAGLLERLEVKLAAADAAESMGAAAESMGEVALPPARPRFSRRLILTAAGLATAAALLLAIGSQLWRPAPREISQDQLTALASQWVEESAPNRSAWKKPTQPAPQVLAIPTTSVAERSFTTAHRERATVFNVTPSGRQQVLLFVVQTRHSYAVRTAPFTRLKNASGGVALAAWQKDGVLYVLAVREADQKLEDYIRQQRYAMVLPSGLVARPA